jgi:hypothetical protein
MPSGLFPSLEERRGAEQGATHTPFVLSCAFAVWVDSHGATARAVERLYRFAPFASDRHLLSFAHGRSGRNTQISSSSPPCQRCAGWVLRSQIGWRGMSLACLSTSFQRPKGVAVRVWRQKVFSRLRHSGSAPFVPRPPEWDNRSPAGAGSYVSSESAATGNAWCPPSRNGWRISCG